MQWSLLAEYCTQNVAEASHTLLNSKRRSTPAIFNGKTLEWVLTYLNATVDGQNPAPPRMMIISFFIGF